MYLPKMPAPARHAARDGDELPIVPNNYENEAKSHFCLVSLMSIRMEVNAARIKKGVPRKGAPQRGETAASTA